MVSSGSPTTATGGDGEILLAKFRGEDVLAGKNASGAVVLKQTMSTLNKHVAKPRGEVNRGRISQIVSVEFAGH